MLHGPKPTQRRAATLRREMTPPEVILWQRLRQRPGGLKFRRQHPAGRYVLDFFCASARIAIEVDGFVHDMGDQPARDVSRDEWLAANGVYVVRIPARDILRNADDVVGRIVAIARADYPSTTRCAGGPPPLAGEE